MGLESPIEKLSRGQRGLCFYFFPYLLMFQREKCWLALLGITTNSESSAQGRGGKDIQEGSRETRWAQAERISSSNEKLAAVLPEQRAVSLDKLGAWVMD